jgi:hypothetical protein
MSGRKVTEQYREREAKFMRKVVVAVGHYFSGLSVDMKTNRDNHNS